MAPKLAPAPQVSAAVSAAWSLSRCQHSSAVLEVVHDGRRRWDEHIIPRISLLTMPIHFDNQLTVVPVQPPLGQWFIRIDQFWVASCAAVWGQTQAWLAVQSGVLSNARPWLTAHQHAELNRLNVSLLGYHTHIQLWMLVYAEIRPSLVCTFSLHFCIHMIRQLREKSTIFRTHSMTQGAAGEGLHIFIWRLESSESHFTTLSNTCWGDNDHGCTAPTQLTLIMQFWTTGMHIEGRGKEPEVEEGGCRRGSVNRVIISVF